MRRALVTGGAGFIGHWVVRALLDDGWKVIALDDLSSGSEENLESFRSEARFTFVEGAIGDERALAEAFAGGPELCLHLAARINVQSSIDDPVGTYEPDVVGTLRVLERCRTAGASFLFMSSCMVYAPARDEPLTESHPVRPASPYAASKLAGEHLTLSYGLAYGHPVTVVRPFNTYGPFQRTDGEGGVVAIFCRRALTGEPIEVFGDGTQTRDLLYAEDCAEFVLRAAVSERARGELLNAGTGHDISILELAELVGGDYRLAEHPHPQAEIARLVCEPAKAKELLGWESRTSLEEGIARTRGWLATLVDRCPVSALLALEGGTPVRETFLPYARQLVGEDDIAAVAEALRSDWLTTGPRVDELERAVAGYVGARYAVAFSSGTAALHGTTFAAGLQAGDEAVVPTFTFAASAACVVYQGATPVLADVDPRTLNLDPAELERRLTARTRAVIVVHFGGVPADMAAIGALARERGVVVIEDAAHAIGAQTPLGACGTLGDLAVFSLHPAKQLTAGEGGVVTTDDEVLAARLRRFRNHCMDTSGRERETSGAYAYSIEELGFNYRLTDIQSALGLSQLAKLDGFLSRRAELAALYDARLAGTGLTLPVVPEGTRPGWHLYVVRLPLERLEADRDLVFRALRAENIGVNVHYIPVHRLGFYARLLGQGPEEFPVAEDAFARCLTLPLFPAMDDGDVESVTVALDKVLTRYAAG